MFEKNKEIKFLKEVVDYLREEVKELRQELENYKIEQRKEKEEEKKKAKFESTISGFETAEDFEKFYAICSDIASKDETFNYEINSEAKEVYIYSEDKDLLHRKSLWFVKKTGIEGLKYTVKGD